MNFNEKVNKWVLAFVVGCIFVGLSIDTGGFIFNLYYVLVIKPAAAKDFWHNDLSALYAYDKGWFIVQASLMIIVGVLKCIMFYMILKIFYSKKLDLVKPFNRQTQRFIYTLSALSFFIGVMSSIGSKYALRFRKEAIAMPDLEDLRLGGADVWLFLAVILLVIGYVFKRGIELQTENELTV